MSKKIDKLANEYVSKLDIDWWTNDRSKDIVSMFTVNQEAVRDILLMFYKEGFSDGYKVANGAEVDEWGNLLTQDELYDGL